MDKIVCRTSRTWDGWVNDIGQAIVGTRLDVSGPKSSEATIEIDSDYFAGQDRCASLVPNDASGDPLANRSFAEVQRSGHVFVDRERVLTSVQRSVDVGCVVVLALVGFT
jgi:hypothetical protein